MVTSLDLCEECEERRREMRVGAFESVLLLHPSAEVIRRGGRGIFRLCVSVLGGVILSHVHTLYVKQRNSHVRPYAGSVMCSQIATAYYRVAVT